MFRFFESRVGNISAPADVTASGPPAGLLAFYWHFMRQTRGLYAAMLVTGLGVALIDTLMPVFLGQLVGLMAASDPALALRKEAPLLAGIGLALLIGRPLMVTLDSMVRNNAVIPGVTTLIRWQSHWHMVRHSSPFFQNDFAGRLANRVMQTANALRESVVASVRAIWYIVVYGISALAMMLSFDWRLAVPMLANRWMRTATVSPPICA